MRAALHRLAEEDALEQVGDGWALTPTGERLRTMIKASLTL